jgi:hypothetical protein
VLAARGLLLVGLDVIGDSLTEINVTSPTCFQEIFDQTGCDVAAMFIDALEETRGGKRVLAHHVVQVRGGMRPQRLPVGEQEVEGAVPGNPRHQFAQRQREFGHAGHVGVRFGQLLHQPAERAFAVGAPTG